MRLVATGLNVFNTSAKPEGRVRYLGSPQDVLRLVGSGGSRDFVILARGGTTTFLAPVLATGARGILTMSGAPESHLGILSREFQIPCIMTLAIEGSERRYSPGLSDPAYFDHIVSLLDGKLVRMECEDAVTGRVSLLDSE